MYHAAKGMFVVVTWGWEARGHAAEVDAGMEDGRSERKETAWIISAYKENSTCKDGYIICHYTRTYKIRDKNRLSCRASIDQKLERLQQLLLRVHTVVEEAEGRYITNSQMLVKLGLVVDAMYQGYYVLDTFKYKPYEELPTQEQVSNSYALSCLARLNKRIRAASSAMGINASFNQEVEAVLGHLETIVANIT
ncbi:hypothetical protein HU200_002420 [Digitaria exilis]|uniref:Uncharacterized protein n=1 Tax=Digitaria exilis TaxID=1010633 RepID=A0A835FWU2_9POAL|nr:hypothetical protein HU200_002420 [Digitaria exilis]